MREKVRATGYWLLATGYWLLATAARVNFAQFLPSLRAIKAKARKSKFLRSGRPPHFPNGNVAPYIPVSQFHIIGSLGGSIGLTRMGAWLNGVRIQSG